MKKILLIIGVFIICNAKSQDTCITDARTYTNTNIIQNGVRAITAQKLNTSLNKIIDAIECVEGGVFVSTDSNTVVNYDVLNSQNTPPVSPSTGDVYLVGTVPTGAWVGHPKDVAEWNGSAWVFTDGIQGDFLYNATTALTYIFRSGNWVQTTGIPALNKGNTISTGLTIGTRNNKDFNFISNNILRGGMLANGSFKVANQGGSGNVLVGADSLGVQRKLYIGDGLSLSNDSLLASGGGGSYIPLSGTAIGSPVTGDIEISNTNRLFSTVDDLTGYVGFDEGLPYLTSINTNTSESMTAVMTTIGLSINTADATGKRGIMGQENYTANILDLDYTQKIYVDSAIAANSGGQSALNDSITAVRSIRKVDTIYRNLDSIVFKINGSRYSFKDSSGTSSGGTVTSVSVVTANGISGTVANSTTTPAITLQVDTISKFATRKQLLDSIDRINTAINTKQETLISGTNIKTVNSNSILGSGNITVSGDSSSLSGLKNATTTSTLANGANVVTWNWSGLSAGTKGLIFGGTDILVNGMTIGLGKNQSTSNVALGSYALVSSTSGLYNTAIGTNALNKLTNGLANTAIGESSLSALTTGQNNIGIGRQALTATLDGGGNIGIGDFALTSMLQAYNNTAIGQNALYNNILGYSNTAIGNSAFINVKGGNNTGVGKDVGTNLTTGTNNTLIGYLTGLGITTGSKNTIIGANVSGLATSLSNTIILADGDGVIRYYCNSAGSTGIGTTTPNASAKLDVSSTTQGVLLPRMTTTQKNAISSPAEGLEVYDLTLHQKSYYNGTTWINY